MRVLLFILAALVAMVQIAYAIHYDRIVYEALLNDLEKEFVERELADRVLAKRELVRNQLGERVRRASEKKSYPHNATKTTTTTTTSKMHSYSPRRVAPVPIHNIFSDDFLPSPLPHLSHPILSLPKYDLSDFRTPSGSPPSAFS